MDIFTIRTNFIVTLSMYILKTVAKAIGGILSGSMAILTDAIHNSVDILQLVAINVGIHYSQKGEDDQFPLGRATLQNVISIVIASSLVFLSFGFFTKSLSMYYGLFFPEAASEENIISMLLGSMEKPANFKSDLLWIPIVIFALSIIMSYVVALFELKVADKVNSPALKADATELLMDMKVEVLSLVIFILMFLLNWAGNFIPFIKLKSSLILNFADASLTIGIAYVACKAGFEILRENGESLLNRSIDKGKRLRIESDIQNISGIDHIELPLKVFHLGDTVYVMGTIHIKKQIKGDGIKIIKSLAELKTGHILKKDYDKFKILYSLKFPEPDISNVETEYRMYINTTFNIDSYEFPEFYKLFKGSQQGDYETVSTLAENLLVQNQTTPKRRGLLLSILFDLFYFQGNPKSEEIIKQIDMLLENHKDDGKLGIQCLAQLQLKQLFYRLDSLRNKDTHINEIEASRDSLKQIYENHNLHNFLRAEAAFYIGRSFFKKEFYDLPKMRKWMNIAQETYDSSYLPINKDRLLNDWGHNESFFYNLVSGKYYLEQAEFLKKLKGDPVGLAISKGCMADISVMEGRFDEAIDLYKEDIDLLDQSNTRFFIDSVKIKLAEANIKKWIIGKDRNCEKNITDVLDTLEQKNTFFAQKAWFKYYYYKWWIDSKDAISLEKAKKSLNKIEEHLQNRFSKDRYLMAFAKLFRARACVVDKKTEEASDLFSQSSSLFKGTENDLPLYAYNVELESERWRKSLSADEGSNEKLFESLEKIKDFFINKTKETDYAADWIIKESTSSRTALESGKSKEGLRRIDRIIWFVEK